MTNILDTLASKASEITPTRYFNWAYVWLDLAFITLLLGLLIWKRRFKTLIHALAFGLLYLAVDFGLFHCVAGTRHIYMIENGVRIAEFSDFQTFWILVWFSFAYGIPNAIFIYMALNKDKYLIHFSVLIFLWWMAVPNISKFGGPATIETYRGTGSYHWIMGVICMVGYTGFIIYQMATGKKMINVLKLVAIGFLAQFSWEFALLVNGVRPQNENAIATLLVNSFIETNMGMPFFYFFNELWKRKANEDLSPVRKEATEGLAE